MNIFQTVLISVLSVFALWVVWILFLFLRGAVKYKSLYRSSFRQVFSAKLSLLITLIFYSITFGLSGGMSSYMNNTSEAIKTNFVEYKSSTNYVDDFNVDYEFLSESAWETMGMTAGTTEEHFINEVNLLFGNDWWQDIGEEYFVTTDTLAGYLLFNSYANDNNISFSFEQQRVWEPTTSPDLANESFFMIGINSWDPFSNEYVGFDNIYNNPLTNSSDNEYIVNEFIIYDGSLEDVYNENPTSGEINVAVQKDYFDNNNLSINDRINKDGVSMVVKASFDAPNWVYSVHSQSNAIVNKKEQSVILANNLDIMDMFDSEKEFIINYGYNSDYESFKKVSSYTNSGPAFDKFSSNRSNDKSYFEENFGSYDDNGTTKYAVEFYFMANGNVSSLPSARASLLVFSFNSDQIFLTVLLAIFIGLVSILMVLLIRRRVRESSKQLGTLKALGFKTSEIAAIFIIFPVVIIMIGGGFALFGSIFIEMLFASWTTNFLTVQLGTTLIPPITILIVFVVPFIFSMIIGYISAKRIIRKETLDLLSNRYKNEPNRIIRGIGYLTPKQVGFQTSYVFKGFLRATGKVALLGVSIFGAVALSSLAMSSSTMVDSIIGSTIEDINYAGYIEQTPSQYTNFYDTQENESYNVTDKTPITFDLIESTINEDGYFNVDAENFAAILSALPAPNNGSWESAHIVLTNLISTSLDLQKEIITFSGEGHETEAYIPVELLLQINIWQSVFSSPIYQVEGEEEFDKRNVELFSGATYYDFELMLQASIKDTIINVYNSEEDLDINDLIYDLINGDIDLSEFMETITPYRSDIIFLDIYYNSSSTIFYQWTNFIGYDIDSSTTNERQLTITEDSSDIEEAYNFKGLAEEAIDEYSGENIPLFVAETFYDWLDDQYDSEGQKIILENNIFSIETEIKTINSSSTTNVVLEYEIVGDYDSAFSYGSFTKFDFMQDQHNEIRFDKNRAWTFETDNNISSTTTMMVADELVETNLPINLNDIMFETTEPISGTLIDSSFVYSQAALVYDTIDSTLLVIAAFSLIIGLILVVIAITEIIDASRREVAMLKSFGYSSWKASLLVLLPYIIIIGVAVGVSIPITLSALGALGTLLTSLSGTTFIFSLTSTQWVILLSVICSLVIMLLGIAYLSFRWTNPLEAIRETEE